MDPLPHARLGLDEIEAVVEEQVERQQQCLGEYL